MSREGTHRARVRRAIFACLSGVGFWALVVGLVIGEGWLRVPGLAVFALFLGLTLWADSRMPQAWDNPQVEGDGQTGRDFYVGDDFDAVWPTRIDDRRVA